MSNVRRKLRELAEDVQRGALVPNLAEQLMDPADALSAVPPAKSADAVGTCGCTATETCAAHVPPAEPPAPAPAAEEKIFEVAERVAAGQADNADAATLLTALSAERARLRVLEQAHEQTRELIEKWDRKAQRSRAIGDISVVLLDCKRELDAVLPAPPEKEQL